MRQALAATMLAAVVLCSSTIAQSRVTDFSGRWVIIASRPESGEPDSLTIETPDELRITQTPQSFTIEHPSKPGTHPAAGTFKFGEGGTVGGTVADLSAAPSSFETRWGISFFGTQLMMSRSTTTIDKGVQTTVASGSFWRLDERGRLVIEFREERAKDRPRVATRVYMRKR
jgi:hypothetical protein